MDAPLLKHGFHNLYRAKNVQNKPKSMPIHEKGKSATPSPITEEV